ncbi:MAG: hypothetical protein ISS28_06475 [Candidatus Cloacimonetes bacterium]|nr:hypothetical protein [Candidatus Cloacimonadota bacterium]MBL7086724.1 hypothetical protein [Candidatus Cloacimonadota bacterium]
MLTIRINNKEIEKEVIDIAKNVYNGNIENCIESIIEKYEDLEDTIDCLKYELKKEKALYNWKDVIDEI